MIRKWTEEDNMFLMENWEKMDVHSLAHNLNRSIRIVKQRATVMGLSKGAVPNPRKKWSIEERALLAKLYPIHRVKEIAILLGVTESIVRSMAAKLGLKKSWTHDQEDLLRERYPLEGASDGLRKDIGKTKSALHEKARKMGVSYSPHKEWTDEEIDLLRQHYPEFGADKVLQTKLKREPCIIWRMVRKLGLRVDKRYRTWNSEIHHDISGSYVSHLKYGAKKRGLDFGVTVEYLWKLFLQQKKRCSLSGRDIYIDPNYSQNRYNYVGDGVKQTASLDRKDSSKGYVEGNVQWIYRDINKMKMGIPNDEFIRICKEIARFNKNFKIDTPPQVDPSS